MQELKKWVDKIHMEEIFQVFFKTRYQVKSAGAKHPVCVIWKRMKQNRVFNTIYSFFINLNKN